jgi:hypothetical protein
MKNLFALLILLLVACNTQAKGKNNATFVGFNKTMIMPIQHGKSSIQTIKLGLPSFSYSTSLEQRFSLNNKLKFSLQYSLTYFNLNIPPSEKSNTPFKMRDFSAGVGANAIYQFRKDACVITGFTINKPVYSCFKTSTPTESPNQKIMIEQKRFELQNSNNWNPYFTVGFEKQFTLFKRDMRYSIQYNFGFMPYRNQYFQQNPSQKETYIQGISIGVKYKL